MKRKNCMTSLLTRSEGTLYAYLAEGVGHSKGEGAFRALSRGYTHWASSRLEELEMNTQNPSFCHVRCLIKPSMETGKYTVYILLGRDGDFATIALATCECAVQSIRKRTTHPIFNYIAIYFRLIKRAS